MSRSEFHSYGSPRAQRYCEQGLSVAGGPASQCVTHTALLVTNTFLPGHSSGKNGKVTSEKSLLLTHLPPLRSARLLPPVDSHPSSFSS